MDFAWLIALCLLVIGFLYSSVGHGGASGYIAVLSLFGVMPTAYKPLILVINIIVASLAFIQFYRAGYFKWRVCWPFLITSIPLAFLGAQVPVEDKFYNLLLGLALMLPIIRLIGIFPSAKAENKPLPLTGALIFGALIGFLSGMLN